MFNNYRLADQQMATANCSAPRPLFFQNPDKP